VRFLCRLNKEKVCEGTQSLSTRRKIKGGRGAWHRRDWGTSHGSQAENDIRATQRKELAEEKGVEEVTGASLYCLVGKERMGESGDQFSGSGENGGRGAARGRGGFMGHRGR